MCYCTGCAAGVLLYYFTGPCTPPHSPWSAAAFFMSPHPYWHLTLSSWSAGKCSCTRAQLTCWPQPCSNSSGSPSASARYCRASLRDAARSGGGHRWVSTERQQRFCMQTIAASSIGLSWARAEAHTHTQAAGQTSTQQVKSSSAAAATSSSAIIASAGALAARTSAATARTPSGTLLHRGWVRRKTSQRCWCSIMQHVASM